MSKNTMQHLFAMIQARFGAVVVTTSEEKRFMRVLNGGMNEAQFPGRPTKVKTWSVTQGLQDWEVTKSLQEWDPTTPGKTPATDTMDLKAALKQVIDTENNAGVLFVFKDVHQHLNEKAPKSVEIIRALRDCAQSLRSRTNTLILLSPTFSMPPELDKEVAMFDFPLPNEADMKSVVNEAYRGWTDQFGKDECDKYSSEIVAELSRACLGMTELEAQDALTLGMYEQNGWGRKLIPSIHSAKQAAIRRVGCLEAIEVTHGMEAVGGLDVLKNWVIKRRKVFTDEAKAYGVSAPKGLMTLGVPGGGKSLSAKAVAASWNIPLIRMDMGAVMGMWLGESEGNMRRALKIAEALAPCVLWVDEVEKGLAGTGPSGGGHETTTRVFGNLLTWMQEKEAPVVLYFTANDVKALPAPLLRKGRIDEIFYVDLPSLKERIEILRIHLNKRKRDPKNFDLDLLAKSSRGFVGAEIEQGIAEALVDAFSEDAPQVLTSHINAAFLRTKPLVELQPEQMEVLRAFVKEGRAVRASTEWEEYIPTPKQELEEEAFIPPGTDLDDAAAELAAAEERIAAELADSTPFTGPLSKHIKKGVSR